MNSPNNPNAFLEHVRTVIRLKHLSIHTEDSYLSTIRRFIVFHGKRHPALLGPEAIRDYLTHLAVEEHVAASTQNVARNALLFLYRDVLGIPLPPSLSSLTLPLLTLPLWGGVGACAGGRSPLGWRGTSRGRTP